MATTRIQHDFDCTEATFWQISFFDEEFSRRLYFDTLRFPSWRLVDQQVTDDALQRKVQVQPPVDNMPGPIRKVLGDRFSYVEEGRLDRRQNRYRFRIIPGTMPDKTHISGEMYTERLDDKRIRRIVEFSVEVKVLMIGKLIEQKTIEDTRASYEKMAVFLRSYLKEKGQAS